MKTNFDVIVVGARVAGSTLAYELAKAGYEVLLVDRSTFPSDILSTHNFFNNSVAMLREMGVLDKLLATGTPLYKRAFVQFEDAVIDGSMPVADGEAHCLCIRRTYLDRVLFDHAAAQETVTAVEGFRVTNVLREGDTVIGIVGKGQDGKPVQYTARLVVGADGRNSTVRQLAGSRVKMSVPTDFASYVAYVKGYRQEGEIGVEFYKKGETMAILFPTSDGLYVVGVMFPLADQAWRERFQRDPWTAMQDLCQAGLAHTAFPERLREAELAGSVKGLLGYDNDWHEGMGKGWALLGDALSFKDPAVGQGMHDAVYGARVLTKVLSEQGEWDGAWEEMAKRYEGEMEAKMMGRYQLACQFSKNLPFPAEQLAAYRLIGSDAAATEVFLGVYNYASEIEDVEREVGRLIGGLQQ